MSGEHLKSVADFIMSDDTSELGKMRAERDYALHCLEREIAIAQRLQAQQEALVKALEELRNEASGWLSAFSVDLRQAMGNTNFAVMEDRVANATAALASLEQS